MYQVICTDALTLLDSIDYVRMVFCDPPDNIGLGYKTYKDNRPDYLEWLANVIELSVAKSDIFWLSYNAKWTFEVGRIVSELVHKYEGLQAKPCVQIYTFGQHNQHDLGNNHRPLIRITQPTVELYPDAIRVPSWRQEHGDKRADPRGRVPGDTFAMQYPSESTTNVGSWLSAALDDPDVCEEMKRDIRQWFETYSGDVFDFPRVTGNSSQRRNYHPTQLHEGLVERCIKLSCKPYDMVVDMFAGTGTTLRVCKRLGIPCTTGDIDRMYCEKIAEENGLQPAISDFWPNGRWWCGTGVGLASRRNRHDKENP